MPRGVKGRRGRGEGGIRQRVDGRWEATISLGYDAQGKRVRRYVYGASKEEVRSKLAQFQQDALYGLPVKPEKLTFAQHYEDWLRTKEASRRSATYLKYRRIGKVHLLPVFGRLPLKDLDYRRINAFYQSLDKKGLAKSTIATIAACLKASLEDAVKKRLIPSNPAKLAMSRTPGHKEARFLKPEELKMFLEAAKGERLEDAFILALNTGLRPGEWLGLPWDAVDLDAAKLTVRQALHEEDGNVFLGEVKTKAARRTISLPAAAVQALKRQRKRQLEEQLAAGGSWHNDAGLVFTDTLGGFLRRTNVERRDLKRVLNKGKELELERLVKAGFTKTGAARQAEGFLAGVTLHTFRHTHASILIAQGVDIKTISRRLGHENITTTLQIYGHLLPGQDENAARRMEEFLKML